MGCLCDRECNILKRRELTVFIAMGGINYAYHLGIKFLSVRKEQLSVFVYHSVDGID